MSVIHLVDLTAWNSVTASAETWRFTEARNGYRHGGQQWGPFLTGGPVLGQHLCGDTLGSQATLEIGDLVIVTARIPRGAGNARFPDDYLFDGHPVLVRRGTADQSPAGMTVVVNGLCNTVEALKTRLVCRISGREARYDRPLAPRYGGTGGVDGPADWAGRPIIFGVGTVDGVEGQYLGLVDGLHAWRLGPSVVDVRAGWVGCSALSKVTGTPGVGQFRVAPATGLVQIGGPIAGFPYTWDVDYDPAGSRTTAHALQRLALTAAGTSIRPGAVAALATAAPAEVGWVWDQEVTLRQAMTDLATGSLVWWLEDAAGQLDMGLLAPPAPGAVAVAEFDARSVVRGSARVASGWPSQGGLVPSEIRLGHRWCPRVHSAEQVQGAADATRRAYATAEWRRQVAALSAPAGARPAAQPLGMDTPLRSGAAAEAARRAAFGAVRFVTLRALGPVLPRGAVVGVTLDYPGLRTRKLATVLSVVPRPRGGAADYRLWVAP